MTTPPGAQALGGIEKADEVSHMLDDVTAKRAPPPCRVDRSAASTCRRSPMVSPRSGRASGAKRRAQHIPWHRRADVDASEAADAPRDRAARICGGGNAAQGPPSWLPRKCNTDGRMRLRQAHWAGAAPEANQIRITDNYTGSRYILEIC